MINLLFCPTCLKLQAHNLCLLPFSFFLFLRSLYRAGYAFPSLFRIPVSGEVLSSEWRTGCSLFLIPKLVYLVIQSILLYLRFVRKQKILIPFGNQDFTAFFSSKWCHQESNLLFRFIPIPWMTAHSRFIFYESHWISLTPNSLLFFINSTSIISLTLQR